MHIESLALADQKDLDLPTCFIGLTGPTTGRHTCSKLSPIIDHVLAARTSTDVLNVCFRLWGATSANAWKWTANTVLICFEESMEQSQAAKTTQKTKSGQKNFPQPSWFQQCNSGTKSFSQKALQLFSYLLKSRKQCTKHEEKMGVFCAHKIPCSSPRLQSGRSRCGQRTKARLVCRASRCILSVPDLCISTSSSSWAQTLFLPTLSVHCAQRMFLWGIRCLLTRKLTHWKGRLPFQTTVTRISTICHKGWMRSFFIKKI